MGANDITNLQAASTIGQLLLAGHHHDDALTFDLYGSIDDGEHIVETVMIAGTQHNITTLLSGRQLENMGLYLDMKDSTQPAGRAWANTYRSQSTHY